MKVLTAEIRRHKNGDCTTDRNKEAAPETVGCSAVKCWRSHRNLIPSRPRVECVVTVKTYPSVVAEA
ncbi:hypothetical protein J6590_014189 [Homalodisca vitripennis]|nr:hypothetical protein J6590_014189 [Homalodisca vitripennis]